MAGSRSDGRGRARRQVPGAQLSNGQATLGPSYAVMVWKCDRCGTAVTDQERHNRFHAGLVALWERGTGVTLDGRSALLLLVQRMGVRTPSVATTAGGVRPFIGHIDG